MMSIARMDRLVWVLIYGGMFGGGVGIALWRNDEPHGLTVLAVGVATAVAGIVLLVVRSRIADAPPGTSPAAAPTPASKETP